MYDVFISYSLKDSKIVDGLSELLRIDGRKVFRDTDSIQPGDQWERQLTGALSGAKQVVVFWCCHASASPWVEREIDDAVSQGKRTIPVLLCDQPLPDSLQPYQWIDLRKIGIHCCTHESEDIEIRKLHPASLTRPPVDELLQRHQPQRRGFSPAIPFIVGFCLFTLAVFRPCPIGIVGEYAAIINALALFAGVLLQAVSLLWWMFSRVLQGMFSAPPPAPPDRMLSSLTSTERTAVAILYNAIKDGNTD